MKTCKNAESERGREGGGRFSRGELPLFPRSSVASSKRVDATVFYLFFLERERGEGRLCGRGNFFYAADVILARKLNSIFGLASKSRDEERFCLAGLDVYIYIYILKI